MSSPPGDFFTAEELKNIFHVGDALQYATQARTIGLTRADFEKAEEDAGGVNPKWFGLAAKYGLQPIHIQKVIRLFPQGIRLPFRYGATPHLADVYNRYTQPPRSVGTRQSPAELLSHICFGNALEFEASKLEGYSHPRAAMKTVIECLETYNPKEPLSDDERAKYRTVCMVFNAWWLPYRIQHYAFRKLVEDLDYTKATTPPQHLGFHGNLFDDGLLGFRLNLICAAQVLVAHLATDERRKDQLRTLSNALEYFPEYNPESVPPPYTPEQYVQDEGADVHNLECFLHDLWSETIHPLFKKETGW